MPQTTNRTFWPVSGGALSVQPGWFPGHSKAFIYVNIGIQVEGQAAPPNMSHPVVPPFQVTGPSNLEYPGQFCLPQIGMPANVSLQVGQNITLQVVEAAQHGAALFSVSLTVAGFGGPESVQMRANYFTVRRPHASRQQRSPDHGGHAAELLQQLRYWLQPLVYHGEPDRYRLNEWLEENDRANNAGHTSTQLCIGSGSSVMR